MYSDVEQARIKSLHPRFKVRVEATLSSLTAQGLRMFVAEGMRSRERQAATYAQGRTRPGPVVTWVRPGFSWHQYGRAADIVFRIGDGPSWADLHPWQVLGQAAENQGLEWGGRWRVPDRPHIQLPSPLSLALLNSAHETERMLRRGAAGSLVAELQRHVNQVEGGPLVVDGHLGPRTEAAVCAFQRLAGLVPDGLVGPATLQALEDARELG